MLDWSIIIRSTIFILIIFEKRDIKMKRNIPIEGDNAALHLIASDFQIIYRKSEETLI